MPARAPLGEGRSWADVRYHVDRILRRLDSNLADLSPADLRKARREMREDANAIDALAEVMASQVAKGLHANPGLVVYGLNPPAGRRRKGQPGRMSRRVYAIEYKHVDDGRDYRHDFDAGVEMVADPSGLLVIGRPDGKTSWKEFP